MSPSLKGEVAKEAALHMLIGKQVASNEIHFLLIDCFLFNTIKNRLPNKAAYFLMNV